MKFWYYRHYTGLALLLLPLSWIFRFIVTTRYFLYRIKLKKKFHFPVPVIVIGNITVGGTGKTPLVIWLANFLKTKGFNPGIVSRGFGGKKQFLPCWVDSQSDPQMVGDEAVLLAKRSHCPVIISVNRVAAVRELLAKKDCDVVLTDDGLQHYRLARDIEIAVIDGERGFGNHCFLPAGPLRESPRRLKKVDFVVHHREEKNGILTMQLFGNEFLSVNNENEYLQIENLSNKTIHAVAGIGNPGRFFSVLREKGLQVIEHVFPDHHLYCAADFYFSDLLPIIMTEKDAVKCKSFADERFWYLPVEVKIDKRFQVALLSKLLDCGGVKNAHR